MPRDRPTNRCRCHCPAPPALRRLSLLDRLVHRRRCHRPPAPLAPRAQHRPPTGTPHATHPTKYITHHLILVYRSYSPSPCPAQTIPTSGFGCLRPLLCCAITAHTGTPTQHPSEFRFEWLLLAAAHNALVLRHFHYDIGRALRAQPFSTLTPGSEFRSPHLLAPPLARHPFWPRFLERITVAAQYPLAPILNADRILHVTASSTLACGNHKSARGLEPRLIEMLKDKVKKGLCKLLHLHCGHDADGALHDVWNPSLWSDVSKVIADLANDLVRQMDWDPISVCAPPQQHLLESPRALDNDKGFVDESDAFAPAFEEMSVWCYPAPSSDCSPRFECYLDDLFGVFREINSTRASAAVPLALHLVGRPVEEGIEESFPRDNLLAVFLAEARPSERKVILGWVINTRAPTLSLPADKHCTWVDGDLCTLRRGSPGWSASSKMLERVDHHPFARNNHYLRWKYAAIAGQDAAITDGTRSQRTRSWERYLGFLDAIGHRHDPYLESLDRAEQIDLFSCFAAAVQEGLSVTKDAGRVAGTGLERQASTVCATLDGVAQVFRVNKLSSPVHDSRGQLEPLLATQFKCYAHNNLETAQQQAVPAAVVSIASHMIGTNLGEAIGQLIVTAFVFFAMRSCEYSTVLGNRRTIPIHLGDVEFRRDGRTLRSRDLSALMVADTVSVVYRTQKNGNWGTIVTQHRTVMNEAAEPLCPVRALAHLVVARIANYEVGKTKWKNLSERPINFVRGEHTSEFTEITSAQVLCHLRAAVVQYGDDRLGFPPKKLGTHSLRSRAATAMLIIAGVPVETIKLIGRWRGDAFLRYIRSQVQQFTKEIATEMTTSPDIVTIGQA
ncbi:hypothetical protein MHU86_6371 [Fragilaria crotonensis]|nr:hypothetical protein MHU86_6371 [Fragilaria crotonensis]